MNSFSHNPFHVLSVTTPVVLLCVRIHKNTIFLWAVLLCFPLHWIFILVVCPFIVAGLAGTCAGQSLPCPVLRRPPEAGQPPVVPPQQQRVQLPGPHRKLLGQDTYVSPDAADVLYTLCLRAVHEPSCLPPSSRTLQWPVHEPRPARPLPQHSPRAQRGWPGPRHEPWSSSAQKESHRQRWVQFLSHLQCADRFKASTLKSLQWHWFHVLSCDDRRFPKNIRKLRKSESCVSEDIKKKKRD